MLSIEDQKVVEILNRIKSEILGIKFGDKNILDGLKSRTSSFIKKVFGSDSSYIEELNKIQFEITNIYLKDFSSIQESAWKKGIENFINLIESIQQEIELESITQGRMLGKLNEETVISKMVRVFIVHGHNVEMKESVARTVEHLGLKPIILHEQANQGRTIIEKFTDYSDVSFAIIILSADDIGFSKSANRNEEKFRARQNVILELGFFLGKLGRGRVFPLIEVIEQFEIPSDYHGVAFVDYDKNGSWRFALAKELKASGHEIDVNKLL